MTLRQVDPDRVRGALLGLAVGDALGTTLEFRPPGTFDPIDDMVGGGPFALAPGHWTDDTSMALCLADSLVACDGFDTASASLTRHGLQPILPITVATVVEGDFEWDDAKARSNLEKHDVSFAEAATVFADPFAVYLDDGSGIDRMVVIGTSLRDHVLYVVHVERGSRDRIISARRANRAERDVYETGDHP